MFFQPSSKPSTPVTISKRSCCVSRDWGFLNPDGFHQSKVFHPLSSRVSFLQSPTGWRFLLVRGLAGMEENACSCQPLNEKCSAAACATVHTAGAFGRAKLAPSLFSPPTPPPPPLPTLSSDSCQLATPALSCPPARLPPPPSCPAAVHNQPSSVCSRDCSNCC